LQPSGNLYSPGFLPSSAPEDYAEDPDGFYGGASFSHDEYSPSTRPAAAQMGRENDVSDLFSEVRYPARTPQTAGGSLSGETDEATSASASDNRPRRRSRLPGIIETITDEQSPTSLASPGNPSSTDPIPQTDGPGEGVRVQTEEIYGSDSSSDEFYSLIDDPPIARSTSDVDDRQTRFGLNRIDEAVDEAEWEDIESDTEPPDIPDASLAISMEDIHNAQSGVYESSPDEDRESTRPQVDKGKGADREANANEDNSTGLDPFPDFDPELSN